MARDLVRLEGLYAGGSAGAAVAGAVKYARRTARKENIVVLLPDGAAKYLSKVFNDEWLKENGFLSDDRSLGRVADLCKLRDRAVHTAGPDDRIRDVIATMKQHGISQLPVAAGDELLGVVSERDLLRYLASGEHSLNTPVRELVESDYATVSPETQLEAVQALLVDVRMALVMDEGKLVDVITKFDLIEYLARQRQSIFPPAG